jgi:hypothetical protein
VVAAAVSRGAVVPVPVKVWLGGHEGQAAGDCTWRIHSPWEDAYQVPYGKRLPNRSKDCVLARSISCAIPEPA